MYTAHGTIDRDACVEDYMPLVRKVAHHLLAKLPPSVQLDDIIQAGVLGLMDAINRFESGQGAQFETYATQRIRGAMLDELRGADWLPRSVRRNQRKIEAAISKLQQQLKRAPTEAELAKELDLPLSEYQELLADACGTQLVFSEDMSGDDDNEGFEARGMADERGDPLATLADARFKQALVGAIEELPEREKLLMGLYYEQELNFKEIAAVLGVTESRVCQLHGQAVTRLRAKLKGWKS